jgi:hypothetical protein
VLERRTAFIGLVSAATGCVLAAGEAYSSPAVSPSLVMHDIVMIIALAYVVGWLAFACYARFAVSRNLPTYVTEWAFLIVFILVEVPVR